MSEQERLSVGSVPLEQPGRPTPERLAHLAETRRGSHILRELFNEIDALRADLERVTRQREMLTLIASDLQWLARRYAAGRSSYAVSMCNDRTRQLLAMGAKLNAPDGTVFAHDGMGRRYDGLSDEDAQASITAGGDGWVHECEAMDRARQAERERDEVRALLAYQSEELGWEITEAFLGGRNIWDEAARQIALGRDATIARFAPDGTEKPR